MATTVAMTITPTVATAQEYDPTRDTNTVATATAGQPDVGVIVGATVGSILGAALIGLIGWIIYETTMPGM